MPEMNRKKPDYAKEEDFQSDGENLGDEWKEDVSKREDWEETEESEEPAGVDGLYGLDELDVEDVELPADLTALAAQIAANPPRKDAQSQKNGGQQNSQRNPALQRNRPSGGDSGSGQNPTQRPGRQSQPPRNPAPRMNRPSVGNGGSGQNPTQRPGRQSQPPRNPAPRMNRPSVGNGGSGQNQTPRPLVPNSQSGGVRRDVPQNSTPREASAREAYMRRLEAQRREKEQERRPKVRRRKLEKPNAALILFTLLIALVVGVSARQIVKNPIDNGDKTSLLQGIFLGGAASNETGTVPGESGSLSGETASGETASGEAASGEAASGDTGSRETTPDQTSPATEIQYVSVPVANTQIGEGDLILVNFEHAYADADTVAVYSVYENKNTSYSVSSTALSLTDPALQALNRLAAAMEEETGCDELLIVSGYRNTADQQSIYDDRVETEGEEYAKLYVATPGYSEHHTGLACDLSFYTASGASVPVADHEFGFWLNEHCAEYGYILRYPDAKVELTKIAYEPWHYRYVGAPHAAIIMKNGLCLEEYVDLLHRYTFEGTMLYASADGTTAEVTAEALPETGTLVYYVPASSGDTTELRLPTVYQSYTVSGDNISGFFVTVTLG